VVKRMQECKLPRKKVLEKMTSPGAAFRESSVEGESASQVAQIICMMHIGNANFTLFHIHIL